MSFFDLDALTLRVQEINSFAWGWPLIIFVIASGIILTLGFNFVQFRYFFTSWRYALKAEQQDTSASERYITPFQAFINALSSSIGNGAMAGMATAVYLGGPGVGFWIFVLGFLMLAIRFAEVYASVNFVEKTATGAMRGGPLVYLKLVPGGAFLPMAYAFFCLMLGFISGNAVQCNSIALGLNRLTSLDNRVVAVMLFFLLLYIMLGGARRIMYFAERIIPIKVGLFFVATIAVAVYHYHNIIPALVLIYQSAFTPQAVSGAIAGLTIQHAIRFGMSRMLNATEVGLGTAGILFGATQSKNPMRSGILSLSTAFISNHLVCFFLVVILVASGVYNSGLTSSPLTQAAYATTFGVVGGNLVVSFLTIVFGLGVLVAYAYMGRECWAYLFNGRFMWLYNAIFCCMALFGSVAKVQVIWDAVDIVNAGLLLINLFGLLWLLPAMRATIPDYTRQLKD